jgi:Ca-activated chloride channel homolog
MTIETNDPRLTAYALGEMSKEERSGFEALLESSPDAKAEVKAIGDLAKELEAELAAGAPIELGGARRNVIESKMIETKAIEGEAVDAPNGKTQSNGKNGGGKRLEVIEGGKKSAGAEKKQTATQSEERSPKLPSPEVVAPVPIVARRGWMWRVAAFGAAAALAAGAFSLFVFNDAKTKSESDSEAFASAAPKATSYGKFGVSGTGRSYAASSAAATSAPLTFIPTPKADMPDGQCPNGCADRFPLTPGQALPENPFVDSRVDPKSTFSVDVDTASYSMIRREIIDGHMPITDYVRIEEMVNYFPYSYSAPDDAAFSVTTDVASAPWEPHHRLMRIGLHGREVKAKSRPASNLVFLIDVSGSMDTPDRLPLLERGLEMLTDNLNERDHVAIVVYAGASGLVLPSTSGADKGVIKSALSQLQAGGSTNGGAGISLAYEEAKKNFVPGGINRVILATDGDFNVGVTNQDELVKLVQDKAKDGVFLTVLGFGRDNYRDSALESFADKGNGNYSYIDSLAEAKKVLVEQGSGTLQTIAKDVKIQVTFDPNVVASFKLLGYENRVLAHQDFANDKKDAGDIGAGHTVTALYEVVLRDGQSAKPSLHMADVALRYKEPDANTSRLVEAHVVDSGTNFEAAPSDFRFAVGVAGFGLLLRGSKTVGDFGYGDVERIASVALGDDPNGYRKEFVDLAKRTGELAHK